MTTRRYADYLRGTAPGLDEPERARRHGPWPSRAWLSRAEHPAAGEWRMTLEREGQRADNHQAGFGDLVRLAETAHVSQYFVWSSEWQDFVRFSRRTLRELD